MLCSSEHSVLSNRDVADSFQNCSLQFKLKLNLQMAAEMKKLESDLLEREAKLQAELVESLGSADTEKRQLAERLSKLMVDREHTEGRLSATNRALEAEAESLRDQLRLLEEAGKEAQAAARAEVETLGREKAKLTAHVRAPDSLFVSMFDFHIMSASVCRAFYVLTLCGQIGGWRETGWGVGGREGEVRYRSLIYARVGTRVDSADRAKREKSCGADCFDRGGITPAASGSGLLRCPFLAKAGDLREMFARGCW